MSKGVWKKYNDLNPKILLLLRNSEVHLTTNDIKRKLNDKFNIFVNWHTANKYLTLMAVGGHINKIEVQGKKNQLHFWTLKGARNAE